MWIRHGDKNLYQALCLGDVSLLDMFDLRLVDGDPHAALADPGSIVVTQSAARRYFGDADRQASPSPPTMARWAATSAAWLDCDHLCMLGARMPLLVAFFLPTTAPPYDDKEYVEPMRIAPEIELSARQRQVLEHLVRSPTVEQRLVQRARIVLAAAGGGLNRDLAKDLGVDAGTVGRWRRRWAAAQERLQAAEESPGASDLRRGVTETLGDAPRSGGPGIFTPEQIVEILAIACEPPEASHRPVSHWTPREVAEEAVKRNIVARISVRTVGRFLKSGGSQAASDPRLAQPGARGSGAVSPTGVHGLYSV